MEGVDPRNFSVVCVLVEVSRQLHTFVVELTGEERLAFFGWEGAWPAAKRRVSALFMLFVPCVDND